MNNIDTHSRPRHVVETVKDVHKLKKALRTRGAPSDPAPGSRNGRHVARIKVAAGGKNLSDLAYPSPRRDPATSKRVHAIAIMAEFDAMPPSQQPRDGGCPLPPDDDPVHLMFPPVSPSNGADDDASDVSSHKESKDADTHHMLFGIDPEKLKNDLAILESDFDRKYMYAAHRETTKIDRKDYVETELLLTNANGNVESQKQRVRSKQTRVESFIEGHTEREKKFQAGFNRLKRFTRSVTDSPRRNGSNYGSDKPVQELRSAANVPKLLGAAAVQNTARWASGVATIGGASTGGAGNIAGLLGIPLAAMDSADAALSMVKLKSNEARNKADLPHHREALKFRAHLGGATQKEARNYLRFDRAATQLLYPTKEARAAVAIQKVDSVNRAVLGPLLGSASTGVQIASLVTSAAVAAVGATVTNAALAPVALASSLLEFREGAKEQLLGRARMLAAKWRKAAMAGVLATYAGHPKYELLAGVVASLGAQQDRLIDEADRTKGFGKFRRIKAVASVPLTLAGITTSLLAFFGVTGAALALGPLGALAAIPGIALLAALTAEIHHQDKVEHKSKWRQRAVHALSFDTPRERLEQELAGTRPDGPKLRISIQEGDYLAEHQIFARTRQIEVVGENNEYLGLRVLTLQVQDCISGKGGDDSTPFIALLYALGVDSVEFLAICKATTGMSSDEQLDFIQEHLAYGYLGMPFRMEGTTQKLPHVSVFLRHFVLAWARALDDYLGSTDAIVKNEAPGTEAFYGKVRSKLIAQYADPKEGMAAFVQRTSEFLSKTEDMPHAHEKKLWNALQRFCVYHHEIEAMDRMAELSSQPDRLDVSARKVKEATRRVNELTKEAMIKKQAAQDAHENRMQAAKEASWAAIDIDEIRPTPSRERVEYAAAKAWELRAVPAMRCWSTRRKRRSSACPS